MFSTIGGNMKTCLACQLEKELSEFPRNKRLKDGYNSRCKICVNMANKSYRESNPEKFKLMRQKHYQTNIEKMRERKRKDVKKYKQQKVAYDLVYRSQNKDKIALYKKDWEKLHKDDPIFKIKRNLRRRVHHALRDNYKSAHTFELIGCTAEEFKTYIENQFEPGMSWENYGPKTWHIDHIKPCYTFDLSDPDQQKLCFHYTNQRPLWSKDNLTRPRS
jgi:hypothetical protein